MGDLDIRFYLSILRRRLPLVVLVTVAITALGGLVAYLLPPVYRATAKILVEAPQIPVDMAKSTVPITPWQQMQIIEQRLTTRENLLDLATRLNVYGVRAAELSREDIVDDMRSRMQFRQFEMDAPPGNSGATVFNVSFDARDPDLSARVTNELVALILNRSTSLRTGHAADTMQFFTQEVARLGGELGSVQQKILEFKNAHQDALPDSLDFRRARQSDGQERLAALEREAAALRNRRVGLQQLFETTGRISNAALTPEEQTLAELNRSLEAQLMIFSPSSPKVAALRARIAALKATIRTDGNGGEAGPSPLDLQLSEIDQRLKAIDQEKAELGGNLTALAQSIAATPATETALASMERDRENLQAQYNTAVAKLAEASTGEQIEQNAKGGRLALVEPALPPAKPAKPQRLRIAAAGLAAGLLGGLGLVVLIELLNDKVRRPKDIVQLLQMRPLETIPYIRTKAEIGMARTKALLASAVAVLIVPAALFSLQYVAPLQTVAEKLAKVLGFGAVM